MSNLYAIFQDVCMRIGVGWLIAVVAGLAFFAVFCGQKALWKCRHGRALVIFSLCMIAYAGVKNLNKVNIVSSDFESQYIFDTGSYVTNDFVHLEFNTLGLPDSAPIVFGWASYDATNVADFVVVRATTWGEWKADYFDVERNEIVWDYSSFDGNAMDVAWYLYTTYVVPPSVHTNGVLNCYGINTPQGGVPKKSIIVEDETITFPPKELGDYNNSVDEIIGAEECTEERIPYELIDK